MCRTPAGKVANVERIPFGERSLPSTSQGSQISASMSAQQISPDYNMYTPNVGNRKRRIKTAKKENPKHSLLSNRTPEEGNEDLADLEGLERANSLLYHNDDDEEIQEISTIPQVVNFVKKCQAETHALILKCHSQTHQYLAKIKAANKEDLSTVAETIVAQCVANMHAIQQNGTPNIAVKTQEREYELEKLLELPWFSIDQVQAVRLSDVKYKAFMEYVQTYISSNRFATNFVSQLFTKELAGRSFYRDNK